MKHEIILYPETNVPEWCAAHDVELSDFGNVPAFSNRASGLSVDSILNQMGVSEKAADEAEFAKRYAEQGECYGPVDAADNIYEFIRDNALTVGPQATGSTGFKWLYRFAQNPFPYRIPL